jgi:hypothetical protein
MIDIWQHGKYVDTWSIVHFFSGILLGMAIFLMGIEFVSALILILTLMFLWEGVEWFIGIVEPWRNVLGDLVTGTLGFLASAYYHYYLSFEFSGIIFYPLLVLTLALSLWGFFDYLKRGYR